MVERALQKLNFNLLRCFFLQSRVFGFFHAYTCSRPTCARTVEMFPEVAGFLLARHRSKNCIARTRFYFGGLHCVLDSGVPVFMVCFALRIMARSRWQK
jgi:hypothetical protein